MNVNKIQSKTALLLIVLIFAASCSNNKLASSDEKTTISASEAHIRKAEMDELTAKNYRDRGVDRMADYYNEEAQKERYSAIENSCDLIDIFLSVITLGFFDCG